jgi:hypothetical protein
MLTAIDEYTRECLAIEVARKLSSLGYRPPAPAGIDTEPELMSA